MRAGRPRSQGSYPSLPPARWALRLLTGCCMGNNRGGMITCIVCGKPVKAGSGAVYAILDGFVGDGAITVGVGNVTPRAEELMQARMDVAP